MCLTRRRVRSLACGFTDINFNLRPNSHSRFTPLTYTCPPEEIMKFVKLLSVALALLFSTLAQAQAWEYRSKTDQMRSTTTRFAEATSTNKINFAAPYSGGSYLELTLRERSKDGLNILFTISKGQFQCVTGCKFFAKFDEGKIYELAATNSSSGSADTIFVEDEAPFLEALRQSKKLIVEMEFYQEGSKQFVFNTAGLKW